MPSLVADTSGLVSLGILAKCDQDPFQLCLDAYEVTIPETVVEELETIAAHDDVHGAGARVALDQNERMQMESAALDPSFPLDDGENAAVVVANELKASLVLCDEFNQLGLIHASLTDTRLVTTPILLSIFAHNDLLSDSEAVAVLDHLIEARGWEGNSYIERARTRLGSE
ncbi:MAG: hypothetical protein ABEH59_05645 [Halobacteriales archaeon]